MQAIRTFIYVILFALLATDGFAQLMPRFGQSRSGTAGFQFVKVPVDARSAAMGASNVADATDGSSLYWNPALAVQMDQSEIFVSHTEYFADISLNYLSYVHKFRYFALGASLQYLDSGDIMETTEFQPFGTGRMFNTIHLSAGLTASQKLTDLFSYGLTLRYLVEQIEDVKVETGTIDFGFFYKVGDTGLRFAVGINNFGIDATPSGETERIGLPTSENPRGNIVENDFENVIAPTTFILSAAYDVYKSSVMDVLVTGQITNPSDNSERISLGSEVTFMSRFMLRTGYQFGVDEAFLPSFGVGVKTRVFNRNTLGVDYGFSTYDRLGSVHRVAVRIGL